MTDLELIFSILGEASTSEIERTRNPKSFDYHKKASKRHLPQNEIIYFRFGESDVDPVQSIYMKMPLLRSIEKVWDMIEPFNQVHTIKDAFLETWVSIWVICLSWVLFLSHSLKLIYIYKKAYIISL